MSALSVELLAAASSPPPTTSASDARVGIAVLIGIAVIVVLISRWKVHAFLALTIGSGVLAAVAAVPLDKAITSFSNGLGTTVAGVGVLIALGAILGKLLADSGGADQIVAGIGLPRRIGAGVAAQGLAGLLRLPLHRRGRVGRLIAARNGLVCALVRLRIGSRRRRRVQIRIDRGVRIDRGDLRRRRQRAQAQRRRGGP